MSTKGYYCRFIQGGLTIWPNNRASACCLGLYSNSFESSQWVQTNASYFDQHSWTEWRVKQQDELQNGIIPQYCRKCPCLQPLGSEQKKNANAFFTEINIINLQSCTLACTFCYLSTILEEYKIKAFNPHLGMFRDIVSKGLVNQHTLISWGGGEPSIHPNLNELYHLFKSTGCRQHFDTNATHYIDFIEDDIHSGMTSVSCSLMSPVRETYLSVMGRDLFHIAWDNTRRYASHGILVRAKIILLPDNEGEEKKFIEKCKEYRIDTVNVDVEISNSDQHENILAKRVAKIMQYASYFGVNIFLGVGITYLGEPFKEKYNHEIDMLQKHVHEVSGTNSKQATIQLKITGNNPQARAKQIFLLGVMSDICSYSDVSRLRVRQNNTWKCETNIHFVAQKYFIADEIDALLEFDIDYTSCLMLRFVSHRWSGTVSVLVDGKSHGILDLFSDSNSIVTYDVLSRLMTSEKRISA